MKENVNIEIAKMKSLMERMQTPLTNFQAMLNEEKYINEAKFPSDKVKVVTTPDEFFKILSEIREGWFVTAGYVTDAKLNRPKIKRKNPLTNKMKGYEDYEGLGEELGSEMSGLVRFTKYNFNWITPKKLDAQYAQYKVDSNAIRAKYGAPPIQDKSKKYKDTMNYGNGIHVYSGDNVEKQGNTYPSQNLANANVSSIYYSIDQQGNILQSFDHEELKAYLFKADPVTKDSGANALRKMGAQEEVIKKYLEEINGLNMKYRSLVDKGLVFLSASLDATKWNLSKVLYINPNLQRTANDIQVNPKDFENLVHEFYEDRMIPVKHRRKSWR